MWIFFFKIRFCKLHRSLGCDWLVMNVGFWQVFVAGTVELLGFEIWNLESLPGSILGLAEVWKGF